MRRRQPRRKFAASMAACVNALSSEAPMLPATLHICGFYPHTKRSRFLGLMTLSPPAAGGLEPLIQDLHLGAL